MDPNSNLTQIYYQIFRPLKIKTALTGVHNKNFFSNKSQMQTDPFANVFFFLADLINFSTSSNKFANICYPVKLVPFKRLFMQIYQFYRVVFSRFFFLLLLLLRAKLPWCHADAIWMCVTLKKKKKKKTSLSHLNF